jgi:phosphoribosylpyrophosphate synthetase
MDERRELRRKECSQNGIHWARASIGTWSDGEMNLAVREWVDEFESAARSKIEAQQLELAERSVLAAESSSIAAAESAKTSGTSARAALFAAFVSVLALIVSIVSLNR